MPEIPAPVRAVMELFESTLSSVPFPDVDERRFRALAEVIDTRVLAVEAARDALDAARAELDAANRDLERLAVRGHAYATIYAQDDPLLSARLQDIALVQKPTKTRRKRKTRRVEPTPPVLVEPRITQLPLTG